MMCSVINRKKKGQVTLFVIIAIILVIIGVLIFLFYPKLKITSKFNEENPNLYIQNCMEDYLKTTVNTIAVNGGYLNPIFYYLHQDEKFAYLCYTNKYVKMCSVQEPFLREHFEFEIMNATNAKAQECFSSLKAKYLQKGYNVDLIEGKITAEILPEKILLKFPKYELTTSKEATKKYNSFMAILDNNLYLLLSIASNVVNWESNFGQSDVAYYSLVYPELRTQRLNQDDGTTLYILENKKTGEKFQFASRSLAFPAGYY
jgi:uncharacterized protein (DUF1330 family)